MFFWMQLPKLNNLFVSETGGEIFFQLTTKIWRLNRDWKSRVGAVSETGDTGTIIGYVYLQQDTKNAFLNATQSFYNSIISA